MKADRKGLMLLLLAALLCLTGCVSSEEQAHTLWVVTEKTEWDGMNSQAEQMIEVFEAEHPGFSVKLDILPQEKMERDLRLSQLRTEIMGGKGPDVYLLPTETNMTRPIDRRVRDVYETEQVVTREWEPLFDNPEKIMMNGLFTDISLFYDADDDLDKENLNSAIMDAGTYRGGRYLLPLRYDFPVLYVNVDLLEQYGLKLEDVDGNILQLLELAAESGKLELAAGADPFLLRLGRGFSLLSQPIDNEAETVRLRKEDLAELLEKIQAVEQLVGQAYEHRRVLNYLNIFDPYDLIHKTEHNNGKTWKSIAGFRYQQMFPDAFPLHVGTLSESVWIKPFARTDKREYAMVPLRGVGDSLDAYVTYFGALGCGCRYPREAYEFLRLFLTEQAQFERSRPFKTEWYLHGKPYHPYLLEDGWPVRTVGSAEAVWDAVRDYLLLCIPYYDNMASIGWPGKYNGSGVYRMQQEDSDIPLLEAEFDHVCFGNVLEQEFARMVRSLNDQRTGAPTDVDIQKMAGDFVRVLKFHVCEG